MATAAVVEWLNARSEQFRDGIEYVAIDPAAVYAAAVRTPDLLPNAVLVVDHFHLVAKANDAVTKVRQRVTWDQRSRRGRAIDPEWANRRRLLRGRGTYVRQRFHSDVERNRCPGPECADPVCVHRERRITATSLSTVRDGWSSASNLAPLAPILHVVHRFADPGVDHVGEDGRHVVAGNQRIHHHRHHQRPN
ncbi:transposase [Rhodococcus sp. (in: high G+C Gram-positive bacteria)]|uniref:transposase n=1 Tax=Rhodococcus sp. TaxID=1831 RepID=UPI0032619C23